MGERAYGIEQARRLGGAPRQPSRPTAQLGEYGAAPPVGVDALLTCTLVDLAHDGAGLQRHICAHAVAGEGERCGDPTVAAPALHTGAPAGKAKPEHGGRARRLESGAEIKEMRH